MKEKETLSSRDKKQLAKQRKEIAKQAQKFHKQQDKKAKKSSLEHKKPVSSKIEQAVNSRKTIKFENISREEKFRRESEKKIRNLEPQDFEDGYYIDEYSARQKQKKRAKEIREQETEVIRRRKKPVTQKQLKIRRRLLYGAIFAIVLAIGITLSLTVLFKTEKIEIEGDKYYYEDQIIAFSGVELQENIFIAAMTSTPENIEKNLPYVENAEISFSIPDTVIIKITDAVPSYVIKNGDGYLVVSAKGRILAEATENTDNLPELKCDELKSTKIGDYVSFNDENVAEILENVTESLKTNEVENVTGFDITDTANILIVYDDRITINIGLPADIDYKIKTAMTIINEKLDPNNTGTVTGTLDVSSCNTTKMSHYKPLESTIPTTVPSSIGATEESTVSADDYMWNETDNSVDEYGDTDDTYTDAQGYVDDGSANAYGEPYDDTADEYAVADE
ncbi:MAG: FtsQ-type POTRA domain-containing protein [Ruminococcus sp.]|nr:FtsQ-type POTRA domain-containing protein [Ruminococcus sp.]